MTIGFLLLALLFSCGPRSGVHEDKPDDGNFCGTQSESKRIDVSYWDKGNKLFKQNCAVCHSAFDDKDFNGPSLKGIRDRLPHPSENYFIKYCINNEKVFLSGDPYAAKLRSEYKDQRMTVFEGILTEQDIREIYNYVTDAKPFVNDTIAQ
ncbi:MAG: cytochrome c [Bacteroidota bacterium]